MTAPIKTKKHFVTLGGVALFIALILLTPVVFYKYVLNYDRTVFERIKPGMSESIVIEMLGGPYKIWTKENAPKYYYETGYQHEDREIKNKVYIYIGAEPIAYIYFNDQNIVEYVFVGGS